VRLSDINLTISVANATERGARLVRDDVRRSLRGQRVGRVLSVELTSGTDSRPFVSQLGSSFTN
jgi:hypothetical protein